MKAVKQKSGNWRVQLMVDGKRKSFTASTKKEAEYQAAEWQLHHNTKSTGLSMTLGEAMEKYIENKSAILSPSTVRSYDSIRRNRLQALQELRLSDLTRESVQLAINIEAKEHSPKTVRNITGLLSATLNEYYPEFVFSPKLPQKKKSEIYIPTKADIDTLLLATEGDNALYIAILLASNLGLRRGEICALEWEDIKDGNAIINKSMVRNKNYKWEIKQPKSYSGYRSVPIPQPTLEAINLRRTDDNRLVAINPSTLTKRFENALKKTSLPHFTFHALRHYYASVMLALGIPDKYAMEIMGHATNNMLKNVYQHTMEDRKVQAVEDIKAYFGE